ncbi:DNA-packaging protein [Candidatus Cytomitobacter indipagum]|uniref:DNA-packaging protein n=1 Tax=Candidatus Cytomitobacter indipagum TaxID=2601575 RepID=A0A5C0UD25_9PROT|nr:terminase family protein [Candidatus Cytomitobacter indipagum]QEK37925.1 DNA-packaging protein [Candidatus Cytomitobacter indipagum]
MQQELLREIYDLGLKLLQKQAKEYDWNLHARDSQKIPSWNWRVWLLMAGRGFGKTRTGAESIRKLVSQGYRNICLLGKNKEDVRKIMIEGKSGLLNIYPEHERPKFFASKNILQWPNGAIAQVHSSDSYESLRGPQFDLAWVDELAKFSNLDETWDQLMMTMRLGIPKVIITTTPKPISLLHKLCKRKDTHYTTGNTLDNEKNLSKEYLEYIKDEYGGTSFGKQELDGELLDDMKMWSDENIYRKNKSSMKFSNVIIAIDPAVTNNENSDETGIIVLAMSNDEIFVLEDKSGKYASFDWIKICDQMCEKYKTRTIVAEVNQGGDMIEDLLRIQNPNIDFHGIRSIHNKVTRAQPVVCLYDQGKIFHVGVFEELEEQMKSFPGFSKSPDRVDALVIGINFLRSKKRLARVSII